MKLFFHSDQVTFNNVVDKKIFSILNPEEIQVGYIPSSSDPSREHFNKQKERYEKYGVKDFLYFDLGDEYDETLVPELLSCNLIHLSGGQTNVFAKNLKHRNFKAVLEKFLKNDGVIVGVSAGSYVMTPTFQIRKIYSDDYEGTTDYQGMGLVDFEFLPHFDTKREHFEKFKEYSKTNNGRKIYLCEDDNGLFVNDSKVEILGTALVLRNGEVIAK